MWLLLIVLGFTLGLFFRGYVCLGLVDSFDFGIRIGLAFLVGCVFCFVLVAFVV